MREGWEYKKLGEVCETSSGGTPSKNNKEYYEDGNIPWLRSGEVAQGLIYKSELFITEKGLNNSSAKLFPIDTIVLAMYGATVGQVGLLKKEMATNQAICGIFPNKRFIPMFLLYSLRAKKPFFMKDAVGGAQPNISQNIIKNTFIPVPLLSEQQRIVEELDLLSSIIEKKKAQLKELDSLAQSIFYEEYKGHYKLVPISNYITSLGGGKSLAGNEECTNKVLKTGAVTYDYFRADEVKFLPIDYVPRPEHLLKDGDLLISRMNTLEYVGACAYVWKAPCNTYLPDRLWRATLKDNVNPIFLWFSLIQERTKEQIRALASGTSGSMKNISIPRFLSIKIKEIPLIIQNTIASKIEAIEHQKELIKQSIKEVETLFNSRMDYYFNG